MNKLVSATEWQKLHPKVSIVLTPDAVALQSLPRESSAGVKLELDSGTTI